MNRTNEIIVTGGGSGGHIIPTLAVSTELKALDANIKIRYVIDRNSPYESMVQEHQSIDVISRVFAGKFRRYHGVSTFGHLTDIKTMLKNARDLVYFAIGLMQSILLLLMHRPSVIFVKGGFVGVPIGLAAALLRVPYVTHDSDTVPGLANRIIAKWAKIHAVGMPANNYSYPKDKTIEVGIPIAEEHYKPVDYTQQQAFKKELGIPQDALVVCVVGGGGGARVIDELVERISEDLLHKVPQLHIIHLFGKLNEHRISEFYENIPPAMRIRVHTVGFTAELYKYSGAADIIITRAGATNMTEFAMQTKVCIIIPAAHLTGGHQTKNAQMYEAANAAVVIDEAAAVKDVNVVVHTLVELLGDATKRATLANNLHGFIQHDSAKKLASIIVDVIHEKA